MHSSKRSRHEAGHVVGAFFTNSAVDYATTIPFGRTQVTLPPIGRDIADAYRTAAYMCLGGMFAADETAPSEQDRHELLPYAVAYSRYYGPAALVRQEQLLQAQLWNWAYDPDIARAIGAVAQQLDARHFISGTEATAIVAPHLARYHTRVQQAAQAQARTAIIANLAMLRATAQHEITTGGGPWAIEPAWFRQMQARLPATADLPPTLGAVRKEPVRMRAGTTAVVHLSGVLTKNHSLFSLLGLGTSTTETRMALLEAALDDKITSILLLTDSAGGEVSGSQELADTVAMVGKVRRVEAYASDLMASAALWSCAPAARITANGTASIGSIGTMAILEDSSARYDRLGIRTHVIATARFKGLGTEGTKVDDDALAYLGDRVKGLNQFFQRTLAKGRGLSPSQLAAVSDGRVFLAGEALRLHLIDGIQPLEQTIRELQG